MHDCEFAHIILNVCVVVTFIKLKPQHMSMLGLGPSDFAMLPANTAVALLNGHSNVLGVVFPSSLNTTSAVLTT